MLPDNNADAWFYDQHESKPVLPVASTVSADDVGACKHCGRCVLAGPPCCYGALYDLYDKSMKENAWLRKVQGKMERRLQKLVKENEELAAEVSGYERDQPF